MTSFPKSPLLQKGAIVGVATGGPKHTIEFQYNPASVSRTITSANGGEGNSNVDATRRKYPPSEELTLDVQIDGTDRLEEADPIALRLGIHPQLAVLELLFYPESPHVIATEALLAGGIIEVVPPKSFMTLFVWGDKRIVPVKLKSFSIEETEYDPNLNPIRAKISLSMTVLNYKDFGLVSEVGTRFMNYQITKEILAKLA